MVWKQIKKDGKKDRQTDVQKEKKKTHYIQHTLALTIKYMAGAHFSLMYSDANENERLGVKVDQPLQTHSCAANKCPQLRGKTFSLQRLLKVCPQDSDTSEASFY